MRCHRHLVIGGHERNLTAFKYVTAARHLPAEQPMLDAPAPVALTAGII